ncbi:hypothetical protein [Streptococcus mutans]|uniref:hypothetical protein n=1 Tax=Streptococcus mutans TaxID=1309 RepID=UPI00066BDBFB|nr:hypothetical protein [Streptococcus mutans]MCY7115589.1 hypothetical protein [Streptococcus mutans]
MFYEIDNKIRCLPNNGGRNNARRLNIEKEPLKVFGNHQAKDGGFSKLLLHPSDTIDEGFISLRASYMLEQKINPYWIAIIT